MMAVTSQFRSTPALGEVWLSQWQAAGLLKPSVVKPVFATIEQALIIGRLGKLDLSDENALRIVIPKIIG